MRDPAAIVAGAREVLDLARPLALSLVALLHCVSDEDGAHELVGRLLSELPSGSYLMTTHATADFTPEESAAAVAKLKAAGVTLALCSREGQSQDHMRRGASTRRLTATTGNGGCRIRSGPRLRP